MLHPMISVDMFRSCKHLVLVVVVVVALIVGVIAMPYLFFPYALPLASAGVGGFPPAAAAAPA